MADILQNINYNIQGYHKERVFDNKGDVFTLSYYQNYDPVGEVFSNLKVRETRTYTRDNTNGLLTERAILIEWYIGGNVIATKNLTKYYTSEEGYAMNQRARKNLTNKASMYLVSAVGLADSQNFLNSVATEISIYIEGDIQPLLDAISASTEPYMNATVKGTLDSILNVSYTS
jgi:hypothetical protein